MTVSETILLLNLIAIIIFGGINIMSDKKNNR